MATRTIKTEAERALFHRYIAAQKLPFTAEIIKGRRRSTEQNRLQRRWLNEAAEQLGDMTPEELRGYCKLVFGVPILRAENEAFAERYDAIFKPLPYETKVALMMEPFDFAVTRLMTSNQKTRYLDAVAKHFAEQGVVLTDPDALGRPSIPHRKTEEEAA